MTYHIIPYNAPDISQKRPSGVCDNRIFLTFCLKDVPAYQVLNQSVYDHMPEQPWNDQWCVECVDKIHDATTHARDR